MTNRMFLTVLLTVCVVTILAGMLAGAGSVRAAPATTIIVTDGSDVAVCPSALTLRCAINFANAHPFTNIRFASNILAVVLDGALPLISADGTWIDGTDTNGTYVGPRIDGAFWSGVAGSAFAISATNVTLSNLTVVGIPLGGADIRIQGGHDTRIVGNYLGIRPGATQCTGDTDYGVLLDSNTSGGADPGGVAYIYNNTISCHASRGIWDYFANNVGIGVDDGGHTFGNKIGTSSDGTHAAGNYDGIEVEGNNLNIRGNLIAYNAATGLLLAYGASSNTVAFNVLTHNGGPGIWTGAGSGNALIGNDIGTDAGGTAVLPNAKEGILISGGTGLFLSDNIVAYNGLAGIAITGNGTQAQIQNNVIRYNSGLPIDLGEDGATPNLAHSPPGPDNWMGYPVVTLVNGTSLFGFTCAGCHVFVYRAVGNPAAPGGGVGTLLDNMFANGSGQWSTNLPSGLTRADVTFSAIDTSGNSSEFSPRPLLLLPLVRR